MMSGFCAIGECMIEISGDGTNGWRLGFAGDTFNTTWYARALLPAAYPVAYFTAFGDDPFSREQQAFFEKHGIASHDSPVIEGGRPGLYAITLDSAGERTFTYWRNDSAARQLARRPAMLARALRDKEIIYFSGITLAILDPSGRKELLAAISQARNAGSKIVFDTNYRPGLWDSADTAKREMAKAMRTCDALLTTSDDETRLHGDSDSGATLERLVAAGIPECVVKCGPEPALLFHANERHEIPAATGVDVRDTTGAGDSFNGAYLAARMQGHSHVQAARLAHRIAARAVSTYGALVPMDELVDERF